GIGTVMALAGIAQRAAHSPYVYGFWHPKEEGNPFGPFINRNHFAGWMIMALSVSLGLLMGMMESASTGLRGGAADGGLVHRYVRWLSTPEFNGIVIVAVAS